MSDFNVTAPRMPSPVGAVTAAAITGTVPDPPRNFAGMDNGTILRGTVQGRGGDGLLTIATDHGILKVATTANLPPGSHVTLEVRAIGDRLQIMVLSVDAPGPLPLPQSPLPQSSGPQASQGPAQQQQGPGPGASSGTNAGGANAGGAASGNVAGGSGVKTPAPAQTDPVATKPVVVVAGQTLSAVVVQALPRDLLQVVETPLPATGGTGAAAQPAAPAPGAPAAGLPTTGNPTAGGVAPGNATSGNVAAGGLPTPNTGLPIDVMGGTSLIPQIRDKIETLFFGTAASPAMTSALAAGDSGLSARAKAATTTLPPNAALLLAQLQDGTAPDAAAALAGTGKPGQTQMAPQAAQQGASQGAAATSLGMLSGELTADRTLSAPLSTGTEVKLQVLAIQNQPGEVLDLPGLSQPGMIGNGKTALLGQIIGQTPAGHPVIHTPVGDLVLHDRISLPTGTKILLTLDLTESVLPGNATPQPLTPQLMAFNQSRGWPTLADLLMTLQPGAAADGNGPAAALSKEMAAAVASLPQAGNRLGASLAAAIEAFRTGNFEKLFAPLSDALKNSGKSDALGKLRDEFMQLSLLAQDGKGQDWRCFFLPIWDDGRLQQINLFYRRPRRGQNDEDGDATRFVVDVNFSRLGACQLDGLVKKARFDLMVRSHHPLPETARREIGNLFAEARSLGNYAGDISFQTAPRFPVAPLEEIAKAPPGIVA